MIAENLRKQIETAVNQPITQVQSLSGGMVGQVYLLTLWDSQQLVAKVATGSDAILHIEGKMLNYLNEHSDLPVPHVIHADRHLLLMTYIQNSGGLTASAQRDAAEYLAQLHSVTADSFGLEFDTLIGGLHQPNRSDDSWIDFFREQRLIYMADVAHDAGQLTTTLLNRVKKFATSLDNYLLEPDAPVLIHGDLWGGNILVKNQKIAGFIDPAIYYAHPEIELAFSTLFSTFGQPFFDAYQSNRPIVPDFFEVRRDIYNLYPLLVHVRLFGGGYSTQVSNTLKRFGY